MSTLNCDAPADLEELTYLSPNEHEIPLGVNLDPNDLQCMVRQTSELLKSIGHKRIAMNAILVSLGQAAKAMQGTLESMYDVTAQSTCKHLNKSMKQFNPVLEGASDMQLTKPPKEEVAQEEDTGIPRDHVEVPLHWEQHGLHLPSPLPNVDAATPKMDVGQLKQEMMNHMSMHRQMWSRQRDQLQVDRVIPVQQADAETAVDTNTNPLSSSMIQQLGTDFPAPALSLSTQLNGMLPIFNIVPANSNQNQKKGDCDGVFDWNMDGDELNEELFDFLV